jgi:hypothetical protein
MFGDRLRAVVQMGDREVGRENRHGIAEDQVFASIEDPLLGLGEMVQAEKAGTFVSVLIAHGGRAASHPPGVVLEADGKPGALNFPLTGLPEQFAAFAKIIPGLFLLREEVETESRKSLQISSFVDGSISFLVNLSILAHFAASPLGLVY